MMYMMTPEQHAQIVASLEATCGGRCNSEYNPCWEYELADKLKSIKPVEPKAFLIEFENGESELHFHDANNSLGETQTPLYAKEQQ